MMNHKSVCSGIRASLRSWPVQLVAVVLYAQRLLTLEHGAIAQDSGYQLGFITVAIAVAFAIKIAISIAISMAIAAATAPKPPKDRLSPPTGIEQFSVPTAEEGRSIQVLFGKKYIEGPNVVWYGDLKSTPVIIRA